MNFKNLHEMNQYYERMNHHDLLNHMRIYGNGNNGLGYKPDKHMTGVGIETYDDLISKYPKYGYYAVTKKQVIELSTGNDLQETTDKALEKLEPHMDKMIGKNIIMTELKNTYDAFKRDKIGAIGGAIAIYIKEGTIISPKRIKLSRAEGNNRFYFSKDYIREHHENLMKDVKQAVREYSVKGYNSPFDSRMIGGALTPDEQDEYDKLKQNIKDKTDGKVKDINGFYDEETQFLVADDFNRYKELRIFKKDKDRTGYEQIENEEEEEYIPYREPYIEYKDYENETERKTWLREIGDENPSSLHNERIRLGNIIKDKILLNLDYNDELDKLGSIYRIPAKASIINGEIVMSKPDKNETLSFAHKETKQQPYKTSILNSEDKIAKSVNEHLEQTIFNKVLDTLDEIIMSNEGNIEVVNEFKSLFDLNQISDRNIITNEMLSVNADKYILDSEIEHLNKQRDKNKHGNDIDYTDYSNSGGKFEFGLCGENNPISNNLFNNEQTNLQVSDLILIKVDRLVKKNAFEEYHSGKISKNDYWEIMNGTPASKQFCSDNIDMDNHYNNEAKDYGALLNLDYRTLYDYNLYMMSEWYKTIKDKFPDDIRLKDPIKFEKDFYATRPYFGVGITVNKYDVENLNNPNRSNDKVYPNTLQQIDFVKQHIKPLWKNKMNSERKTISLEKKKTDDENGIYAKRLNETLNSVLQTEKHNYNNTLTMRFPFGKDDKGIDKYIIGIYDFTNDSLIDNQYILDTYRITAPADARKKSHLIGVKIPINKFVLKG